MSHDTTPKKRDWTNVTRRVGQLLFKSEFCVEARKLCAAVTYATQADLGKAFGVNRRTIARWLSPDGRWAQPAFRKAVAAGRRQRDAAILAASRRRAAAWVVARRKALGWS